MSGWPALSHCGATGHSFPPPQTAGSAAASATLAYAAQDPWVMHGTIKCAEPWWQQLRALPPPDITASGHLGDSACLPAVARHAARSICLKSTSHWLRPAGTTSCLAGSWTSSATARYWQPAPCTSTCSTCRAATWQRLATAVPRCRAASAPAWRWRGRCTRCALHPPALPGSPSAQCPVLNQGAPCTLFLPQDRDIYLLDDCLAAVDAHVGSWLLRHALLGPLLAGRTVVMATHAPAMLDAADRVVHLVGGRVASVEVRPGLPGRSRQLKGDGEFGSAVAQVRAMLGGAEQQRPAAAPELDRSSSGGSSQAAGPLPAAVATGQPFPSKEQPADWEAGDEAGSDGSCNGPTGGRVEEGRQVGHVRWRVYASYLRAMGWSWVVIILCSMALMQVSSIGVAPALFGLQHLIQGSTSLLLLVDDLSALCGSAGEQKWKRHMAGVLGVAHNRPASTCQWHSSTHGMALPGQQDI